ncbi:hypothetical protein HOLleu_27402 [Holothuria leucospilota]|uniref:Uncharacterized protein n=1 Tax=Holothuria leucospilota TaxID=206669 RepID=A0A9Q1BQL2_HOLLE|nr:hypothetical protein HOLleu_27402 [Holothuria leucospilota]
MGSKTLDKPLRVLSFRASSFYFIMILSTVSAMQNDIPRYNTTLPGATSQVNVAP